MNAPVKPAPQELQLRWCNRFAAGRDVTWHSHAETELVAVTRGQCRIRLGEQVLEGVRGSLLVLPAGVAQYQETIGDTRTTYLGFEAPPGLFDESARVLKLDSDDPALEWMEQLCDSHLARPPLSPEVGRTILTALLRRIGDLDAATGSQARLHPAVRTARAYLEANLARVLTLADIAHAAGVSASHLSALFAAQFGAGPLHVLQRLRLERACWLLSNPYLRIHEVAAFCGYEDENYFTRLFHRRMGMTPGMWRRKRLGGSWRIRRGGVEK